MLPPGVDRYYAEQLALAAPALAAVAHLWGRKPPPGDWQLYLDERVALMVAAITAAQQPIVEHSLDFAAERLDREPEVEPDPSGLVGVAGDGLALETLMAGAVVVARVKARKAESVQGLDTGSSARAGWEAGRAAVIMYTQTVLADTRRVASSLGTITRPDSGYVRALTGSSCARCVVLAGRRYRSSIPFDRHPNCDCSHVPCGVEELSSLVLDPRAYFDSLSPAEQDRKFTKAGAQAIRDGADLAQVVNARRGAGLSFSSGRITSAEAAAIRRSRGGRKARAGLVTTEGMTKRGLAGKHMGVGRGKKPQRLMPEAIYQAADGDRELALELLKQHGYVAGSESGSKASRPAKGLSEQKIRGLYRKQSALEVQTLADLPRKHRRGTAHQDVAATNPGRAIPELDTRENCIRVVHAYFLRRRGYDVIAGQGVYRVRTEPGQTTAQESLSAWRRDTGGQVRSVRTSRTEALRRIDRHPNGAAGIISVASVNRQGGASYERHVMVWERRDDRTVFSDPQAGVFDDRDLVTRSSYADSDVIIARLDNAVPTDAVIDVVDPTIRPEG
ncbi:MAG: hypothetical protein QM809_11445 [Gordonia sp. (in: high G+C Gram-positive bacteria)]|uniref:hypothetical protein n=1 Tax=Gordonia sp. (in: high G+C Gram-positive bacteria) TaxID=84139 RepID=UPI0039E655B4